MMTIYNFALSLRTIPEVAWKCHDKRGTLMDVNVRAMFHAASKMMMNKCARNHRKMPLKELID